MKKITLVIFLGSFFVFVANSDFSHAIAPHGEPDRTYPAQTVFAIPIGDDGVNYKGEGRVEMLPWGPASLAIAPDGSFWIADTAGNRLLHYDSSGQSLGAVEISGSVVGAWDLEVDSGGDVLVLDRSAQIPKVVRFGANGNLIDSYEMPEGIRNKDGLTEIALGEGGDILALANGKTYRFAGPRGPVELQELPGHVRAGKVYRTQLSGVRSAERRRGIVNAGGVELEVSVEQELGSMRFLGAAEDGTFFVIVNERARGPRIIVDQTVRRYEASGRMTGVARVPLSERYTYVAQSLALGPDGELYALITKPDRAEVIRLQFVQSLRPILPTRTEVLAEPEVSAQAEPEVSAQAATAYPEPCYNDADCKVPPLGEPWVSRGDMLKRADDYVQHYRYYSDLNINGSCSGRVKPGYFGGEGYYGSVPYDWGGWDDLDPANNSYYDFDELMENGWQAGDVGISEMEGCSKGVDCSGFVTRVWRTCGRCRTSDVENVTKEIDKYSMLPGDILNFKDPGGIRGHMVLFDHWCDSCSSGDICVYESTNMTNVERVYYGCYYFDERFSEYVPMRYERIKADATFLPHFVHDYNDMDSRAYVVNGSTATRNMLFTLHQEDGRTTTTFKWAETEAMGYHELDTTRSSSAAMVRGEGAAVVVEQRHGSGEIDADLGFVNPTYAGLGGGDPNVDHVGKKIYAPVINVDMYDTNTTLNLQNVNAEPATVHITFYRRPGDNADPQEYPAEPITLSAWESLKYQVNAHGCPQGSWSAVIESDKDLAVQVFEINGSNGSTRTYNAVPGGASYTPLYFPAMYKDAWGFFSGLIVQNLDESIAATVYLTFRDREGRINQIKGANSYKLGTIPARRARGLWLGSAALADLPIGWSGSVTIKNSNGVRLAAVANNIRDDGVGFGGYSYNAMSLPAKKIYLPRAMRDVTEDSWGNTGYTVLNRSGYKATVTAHYYDEGSTTPRKSVTFTIPANGVRGFHQKDDTSLGKNWNGFIVLESDSEDRPIMAIMRLDRPNGISGYNGFRPIQPK